MFGYYLQLALRSLLRNRVLTALMIVAVGIGIGSSMTTLTIFRLTSGDPLPHKSGKLFAPQIDNWGPEDRDKNGEPGDQLTHRDVMALMHARAAPRQAGMYSTGFIIKPAEVSQRPFDAQGRATFADFFAMFDAPFLYGSGWSAADDEAHANVIVITRETNDKLFAGANSVGRTVNIEGRDYRVVGVLDHWDPRPRAYDVTNNSFGEVEDVFLPYTTAIEREMPIHGNNNCNKRPESGWLGHLNSECIWNQFWVELPDAQAVAKYRDFLTHYAAEQQAAGRFHWAPLVRLRNLREWLVFEKVVPDDARISVIVGFAFLVVCLVNAIGLMLAKFSGRAGEIGVRRALGATRRAIFVQCLVEAGVIGAVGGVLGLGLTMLGLAGVRASFDEDLARIAHLDTQSVLITLALAIVATVVAGLYPTWRASRVMPAWQLKAQ